MKRLFAFITALCLLLVFAACGQGTNPADSTATPASTAAAPVSAEKTTFKMWNIETSEEMAPTIKNSIKRFQDANPNFAINWEPLANEDYKQKIVIAMGANTAPDIFVTWTGGGMVEYINAKKIIPLTDYMNKDNYKDRFMPGGIDMATYNNDIWSVPVDNAIGAFLIINENLFKKYNLEEPTTLTQLETACDTFMKNGIIPFALANKEKYRASFMYMYLVSRYGGLQPFADAANRVNGGSFESEAFQKASALMYNWAKKGYFGTGYNGLDGENHMQHQIFFSGEGAMMCEAPDITYFNKGMQENPDVKIKLLPFPKFEDGVGDPNTMVGTIGSTFYCVNSACKAPDAAFEFIKYLIDDTAVAERIKTGRIPPVKGVTADNPLSQQMLDIVVNASSVQLWYDQYLSSAMGEIHKDNLQALIGLQITPEKYNSIMEENAKKLAGK